MAKCKIVYRGNTYTQEEFNEYIKLNPAEFQSYLQTPEVAPDPLFQVSDGPTPSKASAKTLKLVNEFLNKAGFDVRKVNQVTVNGIRVDANGVTDVLNRVIQVANGKEDTVLPEEAMHVAVEMIEQQNPKLFQSMLNSIGSYGIYGDVFTAYHANPYYMAAGKPDIRKIKKEAMARILVETIINKTEGTAEKPENLVKVENWWRQFLEWIKGLFNKHGNPFEEAAEMLQENVSAPVRNAEIFLARNPDVVNASMKVVAALRTPKMQSVFSRFYKTNKDKFYQELNLLAPKDQIEILKKWNNTNEPESLDDMVTGVLSELSYTVEIKVAVDQEGAIDRPTDNYSSLTVPGGINYRENEILTPQITPSIKGHAAFATDQGIGWFRSDDQQLKLKTGTRSITREEYNRLLSNPSTVLGEFTEDGITYYMDVDDNIRYGREGDNYFALDVYSPGQPKVRRILEVQSDLFQKGRDIQALTATTNRILVAREERQLDRLVTDLPSENDFLQILNKDSNWIRFFIQSIIQDSAKKGYEKVLFPTGDTASKVEGHTTLEEFVTQKQERIDELERSRTHVWGAQLEDEDGPYKIIDSEKFSTVEEAKIYISRNPSTRHTWTVQPVTPDIEAIDREVQQLKEEIERTNREGFAALKPIWNFYENTVRNIIKKLKYDTTEVTDEYGNKWMEIDIEPTRDLEEFYFQLNSNSQTSEYDKLLDVHNSMVLVDDGGGNSHYEMNGRTIKNRVTDKTKKFYEEKFRGKRINESELSKALNEQKREKGTDGHKDLENMFHRLIDDNGFVRDAPLEQGSPSNLDPNNDTFYNTLWENMQERVSSYPAQTRFMAEVKIYDRATDTAGTIDFLAITPDGKYNILDWKFVDIRDTENDIPWFKRDAWNIQLNEYKRILRESYGARRDDFGQTRVIPIKAKYKFRPNTVDQLMLSEVQIGSVNAAVITDNTVLPVPTRDEATGSKRLDDLIQGLYNLMDKIYETRTKPGEEYKKIERLNDLASAVRQLHVKGTMTDFLEFVYEDVRERIYRSFQPYFTLSDTIKNTRSSAEEKQAAIDQLNQLDNLNELSREILDNHEVLTLYSDINKALRDILDPFDTENKGSFQRAEEVVSNANITIEKIVDLSSALRTNPIARGLGEEDVLDSELSVSFYQKWVRSLSQAATAATSMLWNIVNTINNKLQIEFSDEVSILKSLEKNVSAFQKATGKSWNDVEKMFLNFNSKGRWNGRVISRVDQSFYTELEKVKLNGDIDRLYEIIDRGAYQQWYETELQNRIDSYANRRIRADDEEDRREKDKRIGDFKKQYDVAEYTNTALTPANRMLNSFPNMDLFTSQAYKDLRDKPENKPILDLYDYWERRLEESYDLGLIKSWEKKTFFPNIRKDFLDKMVFGVESSFGSRLAKGVKSVLDGMSIQVDDETFGYTDINGNPQDKLSALYTYDLGEKIVDDDGEEFTDYSNKSTDLFKVMALWNKEMIKYKHKSEVVDVVRLLHFTETNRKAQARSKISGKPAIKAESGDPVLVDNVINSEYYKSFMDYYFYGKRLSEGQDVRFTIPYNRLANRINKFLGTNVIPLSEDDVITVSGKKAIQATNRFFQMKTLGLNFSTAASNFFGGTANAVVTSGKFFNKADFFKGQMLISSGKLWGDNSIYAGLLDYFLPLTDDRTRDEAEKLSVNAAVRYLSSDYLFYLQRQSDKMVQYPAFLAFAENTMVEEGQLINIREFVKQKHNYDNIYNLPAEAQKSLRKTIEAEISSLKETRSLPKISKIENDRLVVPGIERNSKTVYALRNRVQQFAKDALGNMSEEDISQYRMTLLGQSFMMFKNWIPRMADVRFGEFRFQPGTDAYEWGRVRMLFSGLKYGILSGTKALLSTLAGRNQGAVDIARKLYEQKKLETEKKGKTFKMSEAEFIDAYIKGIRSQMKEIGLLISMTAALLYAKSLAPDPEEDARTKGAYKWAVRLFDKMTDELGFFYNPLSFTAIANGSVFPSVQVLNDIFKIVRGVTLEGLYFITGDDEALEGNKVAKYIFKTFPVTKELTLYTAMFNEELAKEYGVRISTESRRIQ